MNDLNDWLCFKCQARMRHAYGLCRQCFGDTAADFLVIAFLVLLGIGALAAIVYGLSIWLRWLLGL